MLVRLDWTQTSLRLTIRGFPLPAVNSAASSGSDRSAVTSRLGLRLRSLNYIRGFFPYVSASQLRVHHLAIPQHRTRPKRGKAWNVRPACRAKGSPDGPRLTARGWRCAVAFFSWSNRRPHCDRCRSSQGAAVPTLAFALVWSWHAPIGPESKRLARIAPSLTQYLCCIAPVGANPAFASCRLRPRIAGPWVFRGWCCDE